MSPDPTVAAHDATERSSRAHAEKEHVRELLARLDAAELQRAPRNTGRNRWTVFVDAVLGGFRKYLPPVHWVGSTAVALVLYAYMRVLAWTARITMTEPEWPSRSSVLAIWHGAAPSLLAAITAMRSRPRLAILVASDARGDMLALLCRLLGLRVVRGDSSHDARKAFAALSAELRAGASVILTADGGGPAQIAKAGPVLLSAVNDVPLLPVGADCRPSLTESHKWDAARNPVPFGRIVVTRGSSAHVVVRSAADLHEHRRQLGDALDRAACEAGRILDSDRGS